MLARAALCVWLACGAGMALADEGEHPLLDLARELQSERDVDARMNYFPPGVRSAEHALEQARPPADVDCARSLGAGVFAQLYDQLAQAHEAGGDYLLAAEAYRHALACAPRNARLYHDLADVLFEARDFAGARAAIDRALEIHPRSVNNWRLAANLDFVEQRWPDAIRRFQYAAASETDRVRAAYLQLMYWLAQARSGIANPVFVDRRHIDGWPRPLLLYLEDQYTEAELANEVRDGDRGYARVSSDERLVEALYYVGQAHLARGQPDLARRYFAAAVTVKLIRFHEHGLAMAEIARLAAQ